MFFKKLNEPFFFKKHTNTTVVPGYTAIARHYGWALKQMFDVLHFENVIIIEEDLEIGVDFFEYFKATLPILRQDPTLMCVSAWCFIFLFLKISKYFCFNYDFLKKE